VTDNIGIYRKFLAEAFSSFDWILPNFSVNHQPNNTSGNGFAQKLRKLHKNLNLPLSKRSEDRDNCYAVFRAACLTSCIFLEFLCKAANNGLQRFSLDIRNNLREDFSVAFIDSEDNSFAARSATAFAFDTTRSEVRFVNFNFFRKR
jgi:hypothetical protein